MNSAIVSALSALAGSALGAISPITSSFLIQRGQAQRDLFYRELELRQHIYAEFIQSGATLYAQATTTSLENVDGVVILYALIGRMRLIASEPVIAAAEEFARCVIARYGEPNLTLEGLRDAAFASQVDPLYAFSSRCREEIKTLFSAYGSPSFGSPILAGR